MAKKEKKKEKRRKQKQEQRREDKIRKKLCKIFLSNGMTLEKEKINKYLPPDFLNPPFET